MVVERLIFDGKHMRATAFEVAGARSLVALFDHRRREPGFPQVSSSGYFVRQGMSQIKITVERSDFFLNADLPAARRALHDYAGQFANVSGMGFSMGGFGCLVFARSMQIRKALLVSPQRPKFPEGRLCGAMDPMAEAEFFSICGGRWAGLPQTLRGQILFDPLYNQGRDRTYARVLADLVPGLTLVAYPMGGHPATGLMTRSGQFYQVQRAFTGPNFSAETFRGIHRATRQLDRAYMQATAAWISDRADRRVIAAPLAAMTLHQAA